MPPLKKQYIFFIVYFLFFQQNLFAQELECEVILDYQQLVTNQATETSVFESMEKAISDFINKQEWTTDEFKSEERIICKMQITLTRMITQGVYEATAQVQAIRPVYGTEYQTLTLNFVDRNFNFTYFPDQPLIFNENAFTDNLTSLLAFYAYVILASDYDSFANLGGQRYAEKAFDIVNIAQQAGEAGWRRAQDTRNRYWVAENLMGAQLAPFREGLYKYHRLGLDRFLIDDKKARQQILEVLQALEEVNNLRPDAVMVNSFFDMKADELIRIFKEALPDTRKEAYRILVKLDPGRTNKYEVLNK